MAYKSQTVQEALQNVLSHIKLVSHERILLKDSLGRILFENAYSDCDLPGFDSSLMDGYAVRSEELRNCSKTNPLSLGVVGRIGAGEVFDGSTRSGHCVRIMTGAPLPPGLDAVIKLEDTALTSGDGLIGSIITYGYPVTPGQHVKKQGSFVKAGDLVVKAGTKIDPFTLGILASTGNHEVAVFKKVRIGLISIGDELVPLDQVPPLGHVRNSSIYTLSGLVNQAGAEAVIYPISQDHPDIIASTLLEATKSCDLVVTAGGSAGGDFDYADKVLRATGDLIYSDVEMVPAQTQGFGLVNNTPVFTLPGQPHAATIAFEVMCRPAILAASGTHDIFRRKMLVPLREGVRENKNYFSRPLYVRGSLVRNTAGLFEAVIPSRHAHPIDKNEEDIPCLLVLSGDPQKRAAGTLVECWWLD